MAVKIDISKVETAAGRISGINGNMRDDFSAVTDAMRMLNQNWNGTAADNARQAFDNMQESYCEYRYAVANDLVALLKVQVGSDYTGTEKNIRSAAEAFK